MRQRRKNYKDHPDHYIRYQKEWKESDTVRTRNDLKFLNQWLQNSLEEMETILSQFDFGTFKSKIHALKEFHPYLDQLEKIISDLNVELRLEIVNFENELKDQYDKIAKEPGCHSKHHRMASVYPSFKTDLKSNLMDHIVKVVNEMKNFDATLMDITNQPLKMMEAFVSSDEIRIIQAVQLELSKFKISVQKMETENANIGLQIRQTFLNSEVRKFSPVLNLDLSDVHSKAEKLKYRIEYDVIDPKLLNDVVQKLANINARYDETRKQMFSEMDNTQTEVKQAIGSWTIDEANHLKEEKSLAISFCYDMYEGLKNFLVNIEVKNSHEMMQELESLEVLIEKSSLCKAEKCNRLYRHYKDGHCPYCHKMDSDWDKINEFKRHLKDCMAKKMYDQLITDGIEHKE